jgi:hypothetical protein
MKKKISYSRGSFGRGKSCSSSIRKSRIAKQIAKKQGLKVINLKLSKCPVEDLAGLPFFHFKPTVTGWLHGDSDAADYMDDIVQDYIDAKMSGNHDGYTVSDAYACIVSKKTKQTEGEV